MENRIEFRTAKSAEIAATVIRVCLVSFSLSLSLLRCVCRACVNFVDFEKQTQLAEYLAKDIVGCSGNRQLRVRIVGQVAITVAVAAN